MAPDPTQQREEAAWHPIYAPGVHPTIVAEYEAIKDERDKWLSLHARADSEAERLLFRAEAAEAEVERLREVLKEWGRRYNEWQDWQDFESARSALSGGEEGDG